MSVRRLRSASSTKRTKTDETKTCPIVGIGASAGGLEAVTSLLNHLPIDTGFGFVLVQHLDPEHESALTQLLARATSLPVTEITHNLSRVHDKLIVDSHNSFSAACDFHCTGLRLVRAHGTLQRDHVIL